MDFTALLDAGKNLKDIQNIYVLECLKYYNGNRTHAAKHLGISLRGIRMKLHELVDDPAFTPPRLGVKKG